MRFILTLILMGLALAGGWVIGTLHPIPQEILRPVINLIESKPPEKATLDVAPPSAQGPDPIDPAETRSVPSAPTQSSDTELSRDAALAQYQTWIEEARIEHPYPESEARMYAVMMCESGGNAAIVNPAGPYNGLFQYVGGTWSGDWNLYRDADIFDARAQIFATALAWSLGMQSHWGCYTRAH